MSGRIIWVRAEWAQRGKTPADRGDRLLHYSEGILGKGNFDEALTRYSPGNLDSLPQVSVSFLPGPQDLRYIALAIHRLGRGVDAVGRNIELTDCFCVRYNELAGDAVPYQSLYESFSQIALPTPDRSPVKVRVTRPYQPKPSANALAHQVAALLIHGRPVCILDADVVTTSDRLAFIDSVMSLLPYGIRSRMSAATWTSSTYRSHKFRLFFSNAPRETVDVPDYEVRWDQPGKSPMRDAPVIVHDYLRWLEEQIQRPITELAEQTAEIGFAERDILQMLERNGVPSRERHDFSPDDGDDDEQEAPRREPEPPAPPRLVFNAADMIDVCSERIATADLKGLRSDVKELESYLNRNAAPDEDMRARCRDIIAARDLLAPLPGIPGRLAESLYSILLQIAFASPLDYPGYCQVEHCLGDREPHRLLVKALDRHGLADVRTKAIVLGYQGTDLASGFRSAALDVTQFVAELATSWRRPRHPRMVADVAMEYLRTTTADYEPTALASELHNHGYLAPALQRRHPSEPEYQADVIDAFLAAAYPRRLSAEEISHILAKNGQPPTIPLLVVVLNMIDARDVEHAQREYLRGALGSTKFHPETLAQISVLTSGGAASPGPIPATKADEVREDPKAPAPVTHQQAPAAEPGRQTVGELKKRKPQPPPKRRILGITVIRFHGFGNDGTSRHPRD